MVIKVFNEIILEFYDRFMGCIKVRCMKKGARNFRGKIIDPYTSNKYIKSTIESTNLYGRVQINGVRRDKRLEICELYRKLESSDRVLNASNSEVPSRIIRFLSLGENFNLPMSKDKNVKQYRSLLSDCERIISSLDTVEGHKNTIRNLVSGVFLRHLNSKNRWAMSDPFERMINNDKKFLGRFLVRNRNLRIIKADKSKQLVIIENSKYVEKMEALLGDKENYRKVRDNPWEELSKKVVKFVEKLERLKFIPKK